MRTMMGIFIAQTFIFVNLLHLGNTNIISVKQSYVNTCEKFWKEAPVTWNYKVINNVQKLATTYDAQQYITKLLDIWEIRGKDGANQFIDTLKLNAEYISSGPAAGDYIDGTYEIGGKKGQATFIYVMMYKESSRIAITYSYHHVDENLIGSNYVYAPLAKDITIDWLKWKAWDTLKGMLPSNIAPQIKWT
jgi:hypothetical protein